MKKLLPYIITMLWTTSLYASSIGGSIIGSQVSFIGQPEVSAGTVTGNTGYFTDLYINGTSSTSTFWTTSTDQTSLTGDKTGSFDLTTTGTGTFDTSFGGSKTGANDAVLHSISFDPADAAYGAIWGIDLPSMRADYGNMYWSSPDAVISSTIAVDDSLMLMSTRADSYPTLTLYSTNVGTVGQIYLDPVVGTFKFYSSGGFNFYDAISSPFYVRDSAFFEELTVAAGIVNCFKGYAYRSSDVDGLGGAIEVGYEQGLGQATPLVRARFAGVLDDASPVDISAQILLNDVLYAKFFKLSDNSTGIDFQAHPITTTGSVTANTVSSNSVTTSDLTATGTITGIALNDIANLDANKTFNNAAYSLSFNFTNPTGQPTYDGAFEIQASGVFTGDLFHVHQHTGNPSTTDLAHFEATDGDVTLLHLIHGATGTCFKISDSDSDNLTIDDQGNLDTIGTATVGGFTMNVSPTSGYVLTTDASGVGTWQSKGTPVKEFYLPAGRFYPSTVSGSSASTRINTGNARSLMAMNFDANTIEYAECEYALPKDYTAGSTFTYRIYWCAGSKSITGQTVSWNLDSAAFPDGAVYLNTGWGTAIEVEDAILAVSGNSITTTSNSVTFAVSGSTVVQASDLATFRVWRNPQDANDNFGGDAGLIGVKIFYQ